MSVPLDLNIEGVPQPSVPTNFVPVKGGETYVVGDGAFRVIEDGSRTDNRIGVVEFTCPPNFSGPPAHWHEMHDEIFYVVKGKLRFHVPESHPVGTLAEPGAKPPGKYIDAAVGETVTVPTRSPHTFSNPFDEECVFINTFTPAFYVNYLKLIAQMNEQGKPMVPATNLKAMSHFATIMADLKK